jgi:hypothetical protein
VKILRNHPAAAGLPLLSLKFHASFMPWSSRFPSIHLFSSVEIGKRESTMNFWEELKEQRWDDHRYYHHNRINQSLHLFSACCFLTTYTLVFSSPVAAALTGWLLAMISRQIGHFFFEPRDYDVANQATHEYKEAIKVGYNLNRKVVLLSIWGLSPLLLYLNPALFGVFEPHTDNDGYLYHISLLWIVLGIGAVMFRTLQLYFQASVQTGLVWFTKIVTDPLHDLLLYHKSPLYVLRGELYDPVVAEPIVEEHIPEHG